MEDLSLDQVLDSNELVFIDSSISQGRGFMRDSYNCNDFESFDPARLIEEKQECGVLLNALMHPNSATIPEVTNEMKQFYRILGEKLSFFSKRKKYKNFKRKNKRSYAKTPRNLREKSARSYIEPDCNVPETLLKELHDLCFLIHQVSKRKEVSINDSRYKSLSEMTKLVSIQLNLKKDDRYLHGLNYKDPHSSDTDEKLSAALFYQSLFSGKNPCLLTADRDFLRLLRVTPRIIGQASFLPYNRDFRKSLEEHPFKLYLLDSYGCYLALSSFSLEFRTEFDLKIIFQEEYSRMSRIIGAYWKDFIDFSPA